jgi:RND superfamily putative drug exporter
VFLLARIQEEYLKSGNNEYAVAQGLARTGRIITSAALILVVVAGSFAFTNLVLVKAVGLGLALAILIDATLIRTLLVPATMRVLGDWNWWAPRWLDRLLATVEEKVGTREPVRTAGLDDGEIIKELAGTAGPRRYAGTDEPGRPAR